MFFQHLFWGRVKLSAFELYRIWKTDQITAADKIFPHPKAPDIPNQLCLRLQRLSIQCWILTWSEFIILMPKQNHPAGFLLTSKWAKLKLFWNSTVSIFWYWQTSPVEDILIFLLTPLLILCQMRKYATDVVRLVKASFFWREWMHLKSEWKASFFCTSSALLEEREATGTHIV